MRRRATAAVGLAFAICVLAPATASAFNPFSAFCTVGGDTWMPKPAAALCNAVASPGKAIGIAKKVVSVGKKLASGHLGGALHTVAGGASKLAPALGLAALVTWVLGGASFALHETATLLGKTTDPELGAAWFSSTYLHMAAIATLLTLPFLFAAVVQALMRSDLAMLARAALGYLPLAMLAIAIAAPLTTLLLAASDSLSNVIEQAAGGQGTAFLLKASVRLGGVTALARAPFEAFLVGFFVAAGALVLWLELLLREVAVYVIVLTLPLVFAAFVWPARRVWAIRAVEMLVALILAKLAIVSVLALGAGALDHASATASIVSLLAGIALVVLGAFAPWVLVKLMPLGEIAAAAAGPVRGHLSAARKSGETMAGPWARVTEEWAGNLVGGMRRMAMDADPTPADHLKDLGREPGSQEPDSATGGAQGGSSQNPLGGTAETPGGQSSSALATPANGESGAPAPVAPMVPSDSAPPAPAAPDEPVPPVRSGTPAPPPPPDPAQHSPNLHQNSHAERGPSPKFQGFPGAEAQSQADDDTWAPDQLWKVFDDDDARPPEDGRL